MSSRKRLKNINDARKEQAEARKKLLKKIQTRRPKSPKTPAPLHDSKLPRISESLPTSQIEQDKARPWGRLRAGMAKLQYYNQANASQEIGLQPWAKGLIDTILTAVDDGEVYLCLVWPAQINTLSLLHALANLERNFARDLRGMRTLLYPGTYTTRTALQKVLVNREQLSDFYRSLWVHEDNSTIISSHTKSDSFSAMLNALNDIRIYHPEVENPSLGEMVPSFMFVDDDHEWKSVVNYPLERSLKKVDRLAHRKNIREKINNEWGDPLISPGALMVLHRRYLKNQWKKALSSQSLKGVGRPELLLLDATSAMDQAGYNVVSRIPNFLRYAYDNNYDGTGAVVVTDDPKIFFMLRSRFNKSKLRKV